MCGRYALHQAPYVVRRRMQEANMRVDGVPEEDQVRLSYNFAPGSYGMVYRANVPDGGAGAQDHASHHEADAQPDAAAEPAVESSKSGDALEYKLQAMKWGLIPFWTKRKPEYGSMMKTINCRDDSLIEDRGMWNTMKKKKRCIVVCQGFYEWLKKNNGKERLPHYIKRKDNDLMCFAGLWDCVTYEGSSEKLYTYTVITTDANPQMKFLHDRMPVIFEPGSEALRTWLDPSLSDWSKSLQSLLKPYEGDLDIYQVTKDVGKVGNNSPTFIVPLDSADNKNNIANFFGAQKKAAKTEETKQEIIKTEEEIDGNGGQVEQDPTETRDTTSKTTTEDNAPLPVDSKGIKREHDEVEDVAAVQPASKTAKITPTKANNSGRKMKSASSNGTVHAADAKRPKGTPQITKFFGK